MEISGSNRGAGPNFICPFGIGIQKDGNILVADGGMKVIVRVDAYTGDRSVISIPD